MRFKQSDSDDETEAEEDKESVMRSEAGARSALVTGKSASISATTLSQSPRGSDAKEEEEDKEDDDDDDDETE